MVWRKQWLWVALVAVLASACGGSDQRSGPRPELAQPNIVLINIDDADLTLLGSEPVASYFPNIHRHLQEGGRRFENLHVVNPLCGPSRASLFRGQYAHNTGIRDNDLATVVGEPDGSWQLFLDQGFADEEIGSWMSRSGYHTALVGKYHHTEFPAASRNNTFHPAGWADFRSSAGNHYFETNRLINGERLRLDPGEFRTDAEADDAVEIIRSSDPQKPLFLYVAPFAPHGSSSTEIFAPRHADLFADVTVERTPDFNEADMTDKAPVFAELAPLTPEDEARIDESHRDRLRSMMAVDEMIGRIFAELESEDMLENTVVMLTSDNGYQLGHNRLSAKRTPFDRSTRVGLLVAGPNVPAGTSSDALLAHIDITATLLDLAAAEQPDLLDGVSFAPLLTGDANAPERTGILVEANGPKSVRDQVLTFEALVLRQDVGGISTSYVEYADGAREFYDLDADPYQLENVYDSLSPDRASELADAMAQLRGCSGASCRGGDALAAPTASIDSTSLDDEQLVITGSTTNPSGASEASSVQLLIRSVQGDQQWDGVAFVDGEARIALEIDANGAWSYEIGLGDEPVWVAVWARGSDGELSPSADSAFVNLEALTTAPRAAFDDDHTNRFAPGPVLVKGTAAALVEGSRIREVRIRITDVSNDFPQYWTGSEWVQETNTWLPTQVTLDDAGNARWTHESLLSVGSYRIEAYAVDSTGTVQTWSHDRPALDLIVG